MEDLLNLYALPFDPKAPVICFDEKPYQLMDQVTDPLPAEPGQNRREDYHYQRKGTCQILCAVEALAGKRMVEVRDQKTRIDYAGFIKTLVDAYPEAEVIHLVQDNFSTHSGGSFYDAFDAITARALVEKIRFHYTPVKASWLNMAEIELSCLSRNCLDKRLPSKEAVIKNLDIRVQTRNQQKATIDWQFSITKARDKFKNYYNN